MSDNPNDPNEPNHRPPKEISFVAHTASMPPHRLDHRVRVTEPESNALQKLKDAFTTFEAKLRQAKKTNDTGKSTIAKKSALYERTNKARMEGRQEAITKQEEAVEATFRKELREAKTSRQVLEATASREEGRSAVAQTKLNYLEEEQTIKAGQQASVKRDTETVDVTFCQANRDAHSNLRAAFNVYVADQENRGRR